MNNAFNNAIDINDEIVTSNARITRKNNYIM